MTTIVATQGTNEFPKVPTGVHNARCVRVIDLGTQRNDYGGNITYKRQVLIIWEVPDQISNDVPMTISKFYTLSLHEKSTLGMD